MLLPAPKCVPASAIEPFEYRLRVPNDPRGVPVARTTLRAALTAHGLGELADKAELLAGEMLTNAIVHTTGAAELRAHWSEWEILRMTVWDTCAEPPCPRAAQPYASNGRGLQLLQALADRWSYFSLPHSPAGAEVKAVWCEITPGSPA